MDGRNPNEVITDLSARRGLGQQRRSPARFKTGPMGLSPTLAPAADVIP